MSTTTLTLRPPPNVDFVHGYPGIPPGGPERPQAAVKGAIELRGGSQGVKAKWLRIELRKVESVPGENGALNTFYDYVGPSPVNLWTSPDEYGVLRNQDFPFSIRIPESIPPSIALDNRAGIQYELVASLCTKGKRNFFRKRKSNVVSTSAAIIIDKHDLHSTWPVYTQPETRQIQAEGGTLTVDRSQTCFGPGDRMSVVACFRSDSISGAVLRGFELSLRETTIFTTGVTGKKASPQPKVTQIGDHKLAINGTLFPGSQHRAELVVNLSPNHTTATLNTARHIDVTYVLTVKAHVDGLPHIAMDLPVIISNWQRNVSQIAVKRIGPTPGLSLNAAPSVSQTVTRPDAAVPNAGAATIGYGGDVMKVAPAGNAQFATTPALGGGGYSDIKADEFGGYGGGFTKPKHGHNPSIGSYNAAGDVKVPIPGTGVGVGARRPGSAAGGGGTTRFTIMNAEPHEIASPDPPRQQLPPTNASSAGTPSSQLAQAYLTAEQEKKLYADARSRVERTQGIAKVITPPPTPPPAQTTTPPPQRNPQQPWASAEAEKQQLKRFHEAQAAVQRTQQGLGAEPEADTDTGAGASSNLGRVSSISKPPIAGGSSAGGSAMATGAALYGQAIAQRDQALARQQSAGNLPQTIPAVPHYLTAEQEKLALRRYEQAKEAVDRVQQDPSEADAGPIQSGSAPIAYESLFPSPPPAAAPAPAPAAPAPVPSDLPPPFEPSPSQAINTAISEKERIRKAYEAQDAAAAAAAARQAVEQQREPSPPPPAPIAPTGAAQIKQALSEKEILRRRYEAEDAARMAATQSPTPAPTPQTQSQQPRTLPSAAGGSRSPRPTPAPPTSPGRVLTAAEEKAMLRAQYAAQDRARQPSPPSQGSQGSYHGGGSNPSSPGPGSSMQMTSSPTQMAPPPLAPRPPAHYIRETQEEDARVSRAMATGSYSDDVEYAPSLSRKGTAASGSLLAPQQLDVQPFSPFQPSLRLDNMSPAPQQNGQ